ncbi:MAG TPA: hypothetical protein VJ862_08480 [Rhodanobacteraceae bacterium]|nr:hypothetical protein [Rhodanobacteraceae bacterium]
MKTAMLLLVGTLILATASAWAAAPKARPGGTLAMFVGTWESHGSFTAADANKPTHVRGRNVCKWSDDTHLFLVCNGVAHVEGMAAPQYQISVYTYDAASGKYRFAGITPNEDVATPNFGLKGNTWSYSGKFTGKDGNTHWFRTLNIFDSPDRYRFVIQSSDDGEHWTTTGSGVSTRT